MIKNKKLEKLKEEIAAILNKEEYQDVYLCAVVLDAKEQDAGLCGNLCPLCAQEIMEDTIENTGLTHQHEDAEKEDVIEEEKIH